MVTIRTQNPNFNGWRAGIEFRNGTARVAELSGKQRQALAERGYRIDDDEDLRPSSSPERHLADMTIAELRQIAEQQGIDLSGATRKPEILAAVEAGVQNVQAGEGGESDPETDGETDSETDPEASGNAESGESTEEETTE